MLTLFCTDKERDFTPRHSNVIHEKRGLSLEKKPLTAVMNVQIILSDATLMIRTGKWNGNCCTSGPVNLLLGTCLFLERE